MVDLNISPVADETGWWTHWLSIQRNISKKMHEQRKVKMLQEVGSIGYMSIQQHSIMLDLSEYLLDFFGLEPKTGGISVLSFMNLFDANAQKKLNTLVVGCLEKGLTGLATLPYESAGGKSWLKFKFDPVLDEEDGSVIEAFAVIHDVTDLVEKNNELNLILETISEGYWDWWLQKDYEYMSPKFWEILGIDPQTKEHHPSEWQGLIHPEDAVKATAAFEEHCKTKGQSPYDLEVRYKHSNGDWIWIQCKGQVIEWDGDQPIRMVGSHTDITKRKQAESEKEAQKETAMIQSRLASIGELSAGVGHEINNPLTIALGSLYGLKEQIKKPEECKPFQRLGEALDRIRDITNGLRVMARHDKKKELVNMNKSVEDSLNFVNEIYKREGVEITSEYKSQPAQALICRSEVQQVLLNLLSNAKDACADCPEKRILVSVLEENGSVKIMVKDNGFGIPQEIQSRIFDQFYTTKASGKGTGLGLSISNNIVRDQVGKLHFDSELNKGTAFYIELPTIASEESSSPFKMDQEAVGPDFSKKVRLLVVDDEPEILEIFKTCLSPLNCDVEFASNGPQALRLLQADDKSYDFVISDIRMPGMSGFELRASLVKNSKSEQVPRFIFVSGGSNFDFAFSAHLEEDAMDIIYKPFNSEDIVNSINVAIDQLAKDEASIHAG